ncbi:UNVERIFIED_CONTAM: hypothetical protein PYX00_004176 [Menopon gallinae]|uniref:Thioredoxin domain-containing protein n=1 Tax=Menopon gallinae TaxID=328185 RepID=A0AAW2I468_9NEOP
MSVEKIVSKNEFENVILNNKIAVVHFYAEWATQCGPMNTVLDEMARQPSFRRVHFAKIEAEVVPEISVQYKISAVPTFIIFKDGEKVDVVNGANPAELTNKINKHAGTNAPTPSVVINPSGQTLEDRLKTLINLP